MPFSLQEIETGLIEVVLVGEATTQDWEQYKQAMLDYVNQCPQKVYLLLNITQMTIGKGLPLAEFGRAPHLTHPNFGYAVMVGTSAFQQFLLKITENNAMKGQDYTNVRLRTSREDGLSLLQELRELDKQVAQIQAQNEHHHEEG